MLNRYKKVFRKVLLVSLLAPMTLFGGSYDFQMGDMVLVNVDQLNGADRWSMEFFVIYHGETWQTEQVYFERYPDPSSEDPDIYLRSFYDQSTGTPDMVFQFHAEPYTTVDTPLELRLPPADVNVSGFNWVYVEYNGTDLSIYFNGTTMKDAHKQAGGTLHSSNEPFEFGSRSQGVGGEESGYTMDEVHFMLDTRPTGGSFQPPNQSYGPMEHTVMLWHFDETGGNQIIDESSHENDGEIDGNGAWETQDAFDSGGGGPGPGMQNTIEVKVILNQSVGNGQLDVAVWFPGLTWDDPPSMSERRGENSPSPPEGWMLSFTDPAIGPNTGPYKVDAIFDLNENGWWDEGEPQMGMDQLFVDNQGYTKVELDIGAGGGGGESRIEIVGMSPPSAAHEGADALVSVEIQTDAGTQSAEFKYMIGGSTSLRSIDLTGSSDGGWHMTYDWEGTIPGSDMTNKGLVGYFSVQDFSGKTLESDPMFIQVTFDEIPIGSTGPEVYRMISAPGLLDNKSSAIDAMVATLVANEQSDDATEWRTFRWNGSDYNESGYASMNPGEAYWIITLGSHVLTGGSGKSTDLSDPVSISLRSGWTQVGSPYNFTPNSYVYEAGAVEPSFYRYSGSGYSTTTTMSPGDGYWVYAYSATSMDVGFERNTLLAREAVNEPFDWKGNIIARVNGVDDTENIFGVMPDASEIWDIADRHEPPVIGNYISVAFDNTHWSERGGFYSRDVHSTQADGHEWPFVVKTNEEGVVSLDFEWTESLPSDWDVVLIDRAVGMVTDLRVEPAYDFACSCSDEGRDFVIVTGPPAFTRGAMDAYDVVPAEYQLSQNFPNPFNAVTTFRFSLPEESSVSIAVYDILGQEIAILANRQAYGAGNHALIWDGRNNAGRMMSTGVYLYRMEAFSSGKAIFQDARKLIMLK